MAKNLRFPCTIFKQDKLQLVMFSASAKRLWDIVQINQREEDKDKGYQRALSPARARNIASFIDKNNILPTSILISFTKAKLSNDKKTLIVSNVSNAGWVIDGQHRLAGAHKAKNDINLPVIAFIKLETQKQINCFVTINREQKGVPTSLYLDLLSALPGIRSEAERTKERASDIADMLRKDEDSPFFNKIVVTYKPKKGQLSLTNFVRKMVPLLKRDGRLGTFTLEESRGVINNYFRALSHVFTTSLLLSQ